jgi:tRNA-binding EMAP/Myf-like protein
MISYEDFAKVDIRVGMIVNVEELPAVKLFNIRTQ